MCDHLLSPEVSISKSARTSPTPFYHWLELKTTLRARHPRFFVIWQNFVLVNWYVSAFVHCLMWCAIRSLYQDGCYSPLVVARLLDLWD